MKRVLFFSLLALLGAVASGQADDAVDAEIEYVLSLLPGRDRADAAIISVTDGQRTVLREGTNHEICELDEPGDEGFAASCYHQGLEAYFQRSRELARAGHSTETARQILAGEFENGSLSIPAGAYQIYVSGARTDPGTLPGSVTVHHLVYLPMTESADVGLPDWDRGTGPWLHNAGTIDSHVMWSEEKSLAN